MRDISKYVGMGKYICNICKYIHIYIYIYRMSIKPVALPPHILQIAQNYEKL